MGSLPPSIRPKAAAWQAGRSVRGCLPRADDPRRLDVVELREHSLQIRIAESRKEVIAGRLSISGIDRVCDAHPRNHASDRRESLLIEVLVVGEVDEELMRPRVRAVAREHERS